MSFTDYGICKSDNGYEPIYYYYDNEEKLVKQEVIQGGGKNDNIDNCQLGIINYFIYDNDLLVQKVQFRVNADFNWEKQLRSVTTYYYDSASLKLIQTIEEGNTSANISSTNMPQYDSNGYLLSIDYQFDTNAESYFYECDNYEYDSDGRLSLHTDADGNILEQYTYDESGKIEYAYGNIYSIVDSVSEADMSQIYATTFDEGSNNFEVTFKYDKHDNLIRITGEAVDEDAVGDVCDICRYEFDDEGHITKAVFLDDEDYGEKAEAILLEYY